MKGLKKICFTTHIDLNPGREKIDPVMKINGEIRRITPELLYRYYNDIYENKQKYLEKVLGVLIGVEIDYFEGVSDIWVNFNRGLKFDYIIGSVHCINGVAFTASKEAPQCFGRYSLNEFFERYFNVIVNLAGSGICDCIGHLDGYRKYAGRYYSSGIDNPPHDLLQNALTAIIDSGLGIEINSAALRHKTGDTYPSKNILKFVSLMGVPVFSVGSDAHSPDGIGSGVEISAGYVREYNLNWRPKC